MANRTFDNLTEKQRDVLGAIAINQDGGHNRMTLNSLIKRGLIERYTDTRPSRFGIMNIYRYRVPGRVHIAWCEYCSQQFEVPRERAKGQE